MILPPSPFNGIASRRFPFCGVPCAPSVPSLYGHMTPARSTGRLYNYIQYCTQVVNQEKGADQRGYMAYSSWRTWHTWHTSLSSAISTILRDDHELIRLNNMGEAGRGIAPLIRTPPGTPVPTSAELDQGVWDCRPAYPAFTLTQHGRTVEQQKKTKTRIAVAV